MSTLDWGRHVGLVSINHFAVERRSFKIVVFSFLTWIKSSNIRVLKTLMVTQVGMHRTALQNWFISRSLNCTLFIPTGLLFLREHQRIVKRIFKCFFHSFVNGRVERSVPMLSLFRAAFANVFAAGPCNVSSKIVGIIHFFTAFACKFIPN